MFQKMKAVGLGLVMSILLGGVIGVTSATPPVENTVEAAVQVADATVQVLNLHSSGTESMTAAVQEAVAVPTAAATHGGPTLRQACLANGGVWVSTGGWWIFGGSYTCRKMGGSSGW